MRYSEVPRDITAHDTARDERLDLDDVRDVHLVTRVLRRLRILPLVGAREWPQHDGLRVYHHGRHWIVVATVAHRRHGVVPVDARRRVYLCTHHPRVALVDVDPGAVLHTGR